MTDWCLQISEHHRIESQGPVAVQLGAEGGFGVHDVACENPTTFKECVLRKDCHGDMEVVVVRTSYCRHKAKKVTVYIEHVHHN
jgi:hypothetical protein